MDLPDYLELVRVKVKDAQDRGDKTEVARLVRLLRDTCDDTLRKLEAEA